MSRALRDLDYACVYGNKINQECRFISFRPLCGDNAQRNVLNRYNTVQI